MLGIFREEIFSPSRVNDDAAILRLTAEAIKRKGYPVRLLSPDELTPETTPDTTFGMCEGPACLRILEKWESMGYCVTNTPLAVQNTHRHRMLALLGRTPIPFPKTVLIRTTEGVNGHFDLKKGVWVKRGDVHSTHPEDVQLLFDRYSIEKALRELHARWISQAVLQEHLRGDLIKFYGVLPRRWFHYFYHKPDEAQGYAFAPKQIQRTAELAASRLGLDVYGGDFVITENGHYLIDVNSWPSFAVCREEAALEIASYVVQRYETWVPRYDFQWRSA